MRQIQNLIDEISSNRSNIVELLLVAIFVALGINLISDGISKIINLQPIWTLIFGLILCLLSSAYFIFNFFKRRVQTRSIEAFLVYKNDENKIIPVNRYRFSEYLSQYLNSAFAENKTLQVKWEKHSLKGLIRPSKKKPEEIKSCEIIQKITEYFILKQLSLCLDDHFSSLGIGGKKLKKFARKDIPDVLFENQFLEMFTKSIEDRPLFLDDFNDSSEDLDKSKVTRTDPESGAETILTYRKGDALYELFELVLPKFSEVKRINENTLEISTRDIKLIINIDFRGLPSILPPGFIESLYGSQAENIHAFQIEIKVEVVFKYGALVSGIGSNYYSWVDGFLLRLIDASSKDSFFNQIGWDSALTVFQLIQNNPQQVQIVVNNQIESLSDSSIKGAGISGMVSGEASSSASRSSYTSSDRKLLYEALLSAFPTQSDLRELIYLGLDLDLQSIVGGESLRETVFQLVSWAEARGRVEDLIRIAYEANPNNPKLQALMQKKS